MKIGFYPGCSLKGGSREYKESVQAMCKAFDFQLVEIPDWNCCGATAAHNLNKELSLALPARILAIAEREGLDEILVPCAACYSRLTITQHELNQNAEMKEKISGMIEMPIRGTSNVMNIIQFVQKYVLDMLQYKLERPFNHKVACYYGCLLVRPHSILQFDREEDPQTMDAVMRAIGATTIDWEFKTECCGAGMSVSRTDLVGKLSGKVVKDALDRGAEAIIVACPMCHSNLDMRRPDIDAYLGVDTKIPVIYLSQAIGLAVGAADHKLGLQRHFVPVNLPERPVMPGASEPVLTTQKSEE